MKLIKTDQFNGDITEKYTHEFDLADDGLYLIEIIASAKSWWQNFKNFKFFLKDDDISLMLDKIEITASASNVTDVRVAWNGNELKGCLKTVLIAIKLKKGEHKLTFTPDKSPYLKGVTISLVEETDVLTYYPTDNNPAQKADGRPWLSFILINLAIKELTISARADKRGRDDDDLKLIIDGETQKNQNKTSHQDWYWCGKVSKGEEKEFKKSVNFNSGLHTIDLWADETPFLYSIELALVENNKSAGDRLSPQFIFNQIDELYQEIGVMVEFFQIPVDLQDSTKYDGPINFAAKEFGVDPIILKATLAQESKFGEEKDHDWRYVGESGLMGLEKKNAIKQLETLGYKFDYNKDEDIIRAAAAYYEWLQNYRSEKLDRFKNPSSPLKLYTQYRIDLNAVKVTKKGIKEFLYYYFYYKNQ